MNKRLAGRLLPALLAVFLAAGCRSISNPVKPGQAEAAETEIAKPESAEAVEADPAGTNPVGTNSAEADSAEIRRGITPIGADPTSVPCLAQRAHIKKGLYL